MYVTSVIDVSSTHMNKIFNFLNDSLQEQSEHDFGITYYFGGELAFSIVFDLFVC